MSYFSTVATVNSSTSPSALPGHGISYWQRVGDTIEWVSFIVVSYFSTVASVKRVDFLIGFAFV